MKRKAALQKKINSITTLLKNQPFGLFNFSSSIPQYWIFLMSIKSSTNNIQINYYNNRSGGTASCQHNHSTTTSLIRKENTTAHIDTPYTRHFLKERALKTHSVLNRSINNRQQQKF